MGNTETLLPSLGGPCCCGELATSEWSYGVGLGEVPGLAQGTSCPLLCPSSAFIFFFSTEEMLHLPSAQHKGLGLLAEGQGLAAAQRWHAGCSRGGGSSPAPTQRVSWEPAHHHPTQLVPEVLVGAGAVVDDGKWDGGNTATLDVTPWDTSSA